MSELKVAYPNQSQNGRQSKIEDQCNNEKYGAKS